MRGWPSTSFASQPHDLHSRVDAPEIGIAAIAERTRLVPGYCTWRELRERRHLPRDVGMPRAKRCACHPRTGVLIS
jgi:hypothetical protein